MQYHDETPTSSEANMGRLDIDWSTVTVSPNGDGLELRVDLDGIPDVDWQASCNGSAEEDALADKELRQWGLVQVSGCSLTMQGLDPDGRERARAYLAGLVAKTNDAIGARLAQQERERLAAERREEELRRRADELAAWFRSTPATGAADDAEETETVSDWASAEHEAQDERAEGSDLRTRLMHPFGTGADSLPRGRTS